MEPVEREVGGRRVWCSPDDGLCLVRIHFTDPDELTRDLPFCLNGREVDWVEVNGLEYRHER